MPNPTAPTPPTPSAAPAPQVRSTPLPPAAAPRTRSVTSPVTTSPAPPLPAPAIPVRDERGRFDKQRTLRRQTVSASTALGAAATGQSVVDKTRDRLKAQVSASAIRPDAPVVTPPPEPAPAPILTAPATPEVSAKVTIGDQEYTSEELQAHLKELHDLKNAPTPAPVAAAAPEPEPPRAPVPLSQEEIAAREAEFIQTTSAALDAPLTEAEVDTLLGGGKEAVAMMTNLRKRDMATAILQARKGIAEGLNPIIEQIFAGLAPLAQQHEQLQRYNITQQFVAKHKDFAPHLDLATSIAEELLKRYPEQASRLSPDQFIDEVARQTDLHLATQFKRFNPQATGSWRTAGQPAAAPARVTPPAPATPPPPAPRPLAATVPQGSPTSGRAMDWQTQTARSLRGR